jgi:hypothetical protein
MLMELDNLNSLRNVIRTIESRRMSWAGLVAHMGISQLHIDFCGKARRKETTRKTYTLFGG